MRSNSHVHYSSHLPVLIKMVSLTKGDVVEFGTGMFSTPVLHWMCVPNKRKLTSYESNRKFYEIAKQYLNEFHDVIFVEDFDKLDIEKPWDIVFIDHQANRRSIEARRVADFAKFVILHDTCGRDEKHYHYQDILPLYKYKYQFNLTRPKTKVLSNFVDVNKLNLW